MSKKYIRCEFPEPSGPGHRAEWGGVVLYYEVGEDLGAVRQIEMFDNGAVLFYDRDHHTDQYGSLAEGELLPLPTDYPYQLGLVEISEFEALWEQLEPLNRVST